MGYPSEHQVIESLKSLVFKSDGSFYRTNGFWHVLMYLRHRACNGIQEKYTFEAFDLAQAAFDINGIILPIKDGEREVYFEPGATQGKDVFKLFRHQDGPRQTYLNRIYTGLTGAGPKQPKLFNATSIALPVTINLLDDWISKFPGYGDNNVFLHEKTHEIICWLFRFGIPKNNNETSFICDHLGGGVLIQSSIVKMQPIPDTNQDLQNDLCKYLGVSESELLALFPNIDEIECGKWIDSSGIDINEFGHVLKSELGKSAINEVNSDISQINSPHNTSDTNKSTEFKNIPLHSLLEEDDQIYIRTLELLNDGFAGVIFSGSPGTGKSWYAREIAIKLTEGDSNNIFFIQFHPGYQYEDFIEGFVPDGQGGFHQEYKTFLRACDRAENTLNNVVIVIDELSRTDTVRVFGETLTYLEKSKRQTPFILASGRTIMIPHNLIILATMNPWDRGVDELDLAFERRFAKIRIDPNPDKLKHFVSKEVLGELTPKFIQFFYMLSTHKNPLCRIGHAYFSNITSEDSLRRIWDNQLCFHFEKVLRHDDEQLTDIKSAWNRIFDN
jgi:5-methylcytosine-specific restriction protein B